jgi:hypothetical protein
LDRYVLPNIIGYLRPDIDGQNVQSRLDQLKAAERSKSFRKRLPAIKIVQEKPVDKTKKVESRPTREPPAEQLSFF